MNRVRRGELPWTKLDVLHRMMLDELLVKFKVDGLTEDEKAQFNRAWHRLKPWPDSVGGPHAPEEAVRHRAAVERQRLAADQHGEVRRACRGTCILSTELVRHYKPDEETYLMPGEFWDLQARGRDDGRGARRRSRVGEGARFQDRVRPSPARVRSRPGRRRVRPPARYDFMARISASWRVSWGLKGGRGQGQEGQEGPGRKTERLRPCEAEDSESEGEHRRRNALGVGPRRQWNQADTWPRKTPGLTRTSRKAPDFAKPILKEIRARVHEACPACQETMKWSTPGFDYKGMMCGMAAFKAHCMFGFWKAPLVIGGSNPHGRFRHLTSVADLPSKKAMAALIRKAMALNNGGVVVERAPRTKKAPARLPADLSGALQKNEKARTAFDAFSPSHKREYIEWITEAKRDETRVKRLQPAVRWIAEGKSRNWKYQ